MTRPQLPQLVEAHPVNDSSGVEVFNATQHLVQEIRETLMIQLHLYDLTQVGVHQLHHQIPGKDPTDAFKTLEKQNEVKNLTTTDLNLVTYTSWNSSKDF